MLKISTMYIGNYLCVQLRLIDAAVIFDEDHFKSAPLSSKGVGVCTLVYDGLDDNLYRKYCQDANRDHHKQSLPVTYCFYLPNKLG